ncbi:MAG: hypothetical protein ACTSVO_03535 [Candidatus Heimdallarchaeaceae archaeon]
MWFKKKYFLLAITFAFYVLLSVLIEPDLLYNYDFLIPWYAALYITKGVPLYEQPEFKIINGESIAFPYHLPIYIYFLASLIWVFGESFIAGKISLVVFIFCDALLLEHLVRKKLPEESKEKKVWKYFSLILLLNPLIIIYTFTGQFDSLPILYFLISYYFFDKIEGETNYKTIIFSFLSGLSLGVGFLTKIIPMLLAPVIFLGLLFKKKYSETAVFTLTFLGFCGGMLTYLFTVYPFINYLGIGWQMQRGANSMSVYYYLFELYFNVDFNFTADAILVGIGMVVLTGFFIFELYKKKKLDLFMFSGIYIITFFLLYRVFYPHYLLWIIPYLSIIVVKYIEKKQFRNMIILFSVIFIEIITIILWYLDFFSIFLLPLWLILAISFINMICLIYYLYTFYIFRKES